MCCTLPACVQCVLAVYTVMVCSVHINYTLLGLMMHETLMSETHLMHESHEIHCTVIHLNSTYWCSQPMFCLQSLHFVMSVEWAEGVLVVFYFLHSQKGLPHHSLPLSPTSSPLGTIQPNPQNAPSVLNIRASINSLSCKGRGGGSSNKWLQPHTVHVVRTVQTRRHISQDCSDRSHTKYQVRWRPSLQVTAQPSHLAMWGRGNPGWNAPGIDEVGGTGNGKATWKRESTNNLLFSPHCTLPHLHTAMQLTQ